MLTFIDFSDGAGLLVLPVWCFLSRSSSGDLDEGNYKTDSFGYRFLFVYLRGK